MEWTMNIDIFRSLEEFPRHVLLQHGCECYWRATWHHRKPCKIFKTCTTNPNRCQHCFPEFNDLHYVVHCPVSFESFHTTALISCAETRDSGIESWQIANEIVFGHDIVIEDVAPNHLIQVVYLKCKPWINHLRDLPNGPECSKRWSFFYLPRV